MMMITIIFTSLSVLMYFMNILKGKLNRKLTTMAENWM